MTIEQQLREVEAALNDSWAKYDKRRFKIAMLEEGLFDADENEENGWEREENLESEYHELSILKRRIDSLEKLEAQLKKNLE
jgi:hypothetical protein